MQGRARVLDSTTCLAVEEPGGLDVGDEIAAAVTGGRRQQQHEADLLVELSHEVPAQRLSRGDHRLLGNIDVPGIRAQCALGV
jgi:hypothetical protein